MTNLGSCPILVKSTALRHCFVVDAPVMTAQNAPLHSRGGFRPSFASGFTLFLE
jgi:hypothetical protein